MKVLLKVDDSEVVTKFNLLKELFKNSKFEVTLIEVKAKSMSGKTIIQNRIQIERKNG